jgi:hypothetical protein
MFPTPILVFQIEDFLQNKNVNSFVFLHTLSRNSGCVASVIIYCHDTWFRLGSFSNEILMFLFIGYSATDTCNTVFLLRPYQLRDTNTLSVFVVVVLSVVNNDLS